MTEISRAQGPGRVEGEPIDYDNYRARAHALRQQAKRDVPRALWRAVRRLFRNARPVNARAKINLR